jgi:hypothetical protein
MAHTITFVRNPTSAVTTRRLVIKVPLASGKYDFMAHTITFYTLQRRGMLVERMHGDEFVCLWIDGSIDLSDCTVFARSDNSRPACSIGINKKIKVCKSHEQRCCLSFVGQRLATQDY